MKRILPVAVLALAAAGVAAWFLTLDVPEGHRAVAVRGGVAAEWGPGRHFNLPGGAVTVYSMEPATFAFPGPRSDYRLFDGSGNPLPVTLTVEAVPVAGTLAALHEAVGGAIEDTLRSRLRANARAEAARIPADDPDPARTLARALAPAVEVPGLRVELRGGSEREDERVHPTGVSVLLVGIDGGDWKNIDPLLERGELPHLSRLLRDGVRADLNSLTPMLSPLLWTTIATGTTPDRHGILDFLTTDPETGERIPVTRRQRREPAFWNTFTEFSISQAVVGWLATWPAEPISGHMVTDRFGYLAFAASDTDRSLTRGMTWPPEFVDHARSLEVTSVPQKVWGDLARLTSDDLARLDAGGFEKGDLLRNLSRTIEAALTSTAIAEDLLATEHPRVTAVYYEMVDAAAHLVMPYAPPRRADVPEEDFLRYRDSHDGVYRLQDRLLGRLLEHTDDNTVVILLSDHGFKSGAERPAGSSQIEGGEAARWHREPGILTLTGPGIRRGVTLDDPVDLVDIAPTLLTLTGVPVPEDLDGRVLTEAFSGDKEARYVVRRQAVELRPEVWTRPPRTENATKAQAASLHNNLGLVYQSEGKLAQAEAEFRKAMAAVPKDRISRTNLGSILLQMGRLEEAEPILEALLAEYPRHPPALFNLGMLYLRTKRLEKAEVMFRRVRDVDPAHEGARVNLGHAVLRQGRLDEAGTLFEEAIARFPGAANAHFGLGIVHAERRDYQRAAAAFRKTLEIDPDHKTAARNLAAVEQAIGG